MAKNKKSAETTDDQHSIEYVPKADMNVVRKRKTAVVEGSLAAMVKEHGTVSQEIILSEARDPSHPLHEYFDWDDSTAAHKWRVAQATQMIVATRFICFLKEDRDRKQIDSVVKGSRSSTGVPVRRFLPAFTEDGFKERTDVLSDDEARKSIVERKIKVLRSWCDSVIDIVELASIRNRLLELLD